MRYLIGKSSLVSPVKGRDLNAQISDRHHSDGLFILDLYVHITHDPLSTTHSGRAEFHSAKVSLHLGYRGYIGCTHSICYGLD